MARCADSSEETAVSCVDGSRARRLEAPLPGLLPQDEHGMCMQPRCRLLSMDHA